MAADDLSAPLAPRWRASRFRAGQLIYMALFATLGLVAIGVGFIGWAVLSADRLGGEPVAILALDETPPAAMPSQAGEQAAMPMRDTLQPGSGDETEDARRTTRIAGNIAARGEDTAPGDGAAIIHRVGEGASGPLPAVPDPGLVERTKSGPLPRIGEDGRRPSQIYARTDSQGNAVGAGQPARIALMIGGLGISATATGEAIRKLPGAVSLAFAPYGRDLQTWINKARQNGHEVLLQLPMEPFDYPDNDPGPHTLLADNNKSENLTRLHWLMSRFTGYFAVTNYMGAKFTSSPEALSPVLREIALRGLAYVDDATSPRSAAIGTGAQHGLESAAADLVVDLGETRQSIDEALRRLEVLAQERGFALATGTAFPLTVDRIAAWARELPGRGIVLVPVSSAISRQPQT